ncbi:hypothetical protein H6P81_010879 [Aristolochia fimbriata]|uniref:Uncharacterized protein n=1 Tax=Aristolochia fimbriata TaxID=158543 RepID=A0AAV7EQQ0_ARIFI|nr:hypothetical protein H6P81_010879 [Aristolochia fimbriata]
MESYRVLEGAKLCQRCRTIDATFVYPVIVRTIKLLVIQPTDMGRLIQTDRPLIEIRLLNRTASQKEKPAIAKEAFLSYIFLTVPYCINQAPLSGKTTNDEQNKDPGNKNLQHYHLKGAK